ncbi:MAG: hypothetical protein KAJ46_08170, partial [Sedimentisphaerales bacterium]|nr:hypothetical protein [Sedimentisphaerales bacterium]
PLIKSISHPPSSAVPSEFSSSLVAIIVSYFMQKNVETVEKSVRRDACSTVFFSRPYGTKII